MQEFWKFVLHHATYIKYWLLWLLIFFMIISIRTYLNYASINDAIVVVDQHKNLVQDEIYFTEKFLIAYLSSDYADYFLSHENNILKWWELIVRFDDADSRVTSWQNIVESYTNSITNSTKSAKEYWKDFLKLKWREVFG